MKKRKSRKTAEQRPLPKVSEEDAKLPVTKDNYFARAAHFSAEKKIPPAVIIVGTEQWRAWHQYFEQHLGWVPMAMRRILVQAVDAPRSFTVPWEWPEGFDASFRTDPSWKPAAEWKPAPKHAHATGDELRARHGPTWGLKNMADPERERRRRESEQRLQEAHERRLKHAGAVEVGGVLVSPALVASIEEQNKRRAAIPSSD